MRKMKETKASPEALSLLLNELSFEYFHLVSLVWRSFGFEKCRTRPNNMEKCRGSQKLRRQGWVDELSCRCLRLSGKSPLLVYFVTKG